MEPRINGEWQTTRTLFGRHVPGAETPARNAARAGLEQAQQRRHEVVRAFVKQLRGKLGDAAAERAWIFNVRGVGYDHEAWTAMAATSMHAEDDDPDDGARH